MLKIRAMCTKDDSNGLCDLNDELLVVREFDPATSLPTGRWELDTSNMYCPEHDNCQGFWRIVLIDEVK
jgi:hypothetical protein